VKFLTLYDEEALQATILTAIESELFQEAYETNSLDIYKSGVLVLEQHSHCRDCGKFISGEYHYAQHRAYEHDDWALVENYHAKSWKVMLSDHIELFEERK